jgi:hypothetical protein
MAARGEREQGSLTAPWRRDAVPAAAPALHKHEAGMLAVAALAFLHQQACCPLETLHGEPGAEGRTPTVGAGTGEGERSVHGAMRTDLGFESDGSRGCESGKHA